MQPLPLLLTALALAAPPTSTLDGRSAGDLTGAVALFWRADCAPCVAELADLRALRRAAAPLHVTPVALEQAPGDVGPVEQVLAKAGLRGSDTLRTRMAPADLLTAYGGAPPRLPLAVAFDGAGRACARRTGLLGYDRLRTWARLCGVRDAARR